MSYKVAALTVYRVLMPSYGPFWTQLSYSQKMRKENISHTTGVSFSSVILAIQGHSTLQMLIPSGRHPLKGRSPWPTWAITCVCWGGRGGELP